jgi:hypothetical protein
MTMGDALRDAWLGAVGEHLAHRAQRSRLTTSS